MRITSDLRFSPERIYDAQTVGTLSGGQRAKLCLLRPILSVSHDRKCLLEVADILYRLTPEGLIRQW